MKWPLLFDMKIMTLSVGEQRPMEKDQLFFFY